MRVLIPALIIVAALTQAPASVSQGQQAPAKNKSDVAKQSPVMRGEPSTTVVNNPGLTEKHESPKEQSKWWIPPPPWDIYWPTIGLVIGTGFAVWAALKTLRAINAQVVKMRETGKQTDKLIAESIAQTQTLVQQAESLAKSAYHLGESANATYRSASAMESVAEKIAVSTEAAMASVSAIGQQMRAYICVDIGSAIYQERTKNMKFQAVPSIVNADCVAGRGRPALQRNRAAGAAAACRPWSLARAGTQQSGPSGGGACARGDSGHLAGCRRGRQTRARSEVACRQPRRGGFFQDAGAAPGHPRARARPLFLLPATDQRAHAVPQGCASLPGF